MISDIFLRSEKKRRKRLVVSREKLLKEKSPDKNKLRQKIHLRFNTRRCEELSEWESIIISGRRSDFFIYSQGTYQFLWLITSPCDCKRYFFSFAIFFVNYGHRQLPSVIGTTVGN